MISQLWINNKGYSLMGISHWPESGSIKAGAVLMAGFSQPKCDEDFIMSKLARRLADEGIFVLQFDPRGHGDSSFMLEDVTLGTIREDIKSSIEFVKGIAGANIFGVGRGLSAAILAETAGYVGLKGVAGISPYCLDKLISKEIWGHMKPGVYEAAEIVDRSEYDKCAFFEALGAKMGNLLGQRISSEMINELVQFEVPDIMLAYGEKGLWLFYDKDSEFEIKRWIPTDNNSHLPLAHYLNKSLPRRALWHHNVIESICNWIKQQGDIKDGNTCSD